MRLVDILLAGPYNVLLVLAVMTGIGLAIHRARVDGHPPLAWLVLLAAALSGGLIGSKVFFDLQGGAPGDKTILGGLLLGVLSAMAAARVLGLGVRRSLDTLVHPALVAMAIGRVGCFLAGCCRGTEADGLPWEIHPVQLYEAGADLLLLGVLARRLPAGVPGRRIGLGVAGYAGLRFLTEFVRDGREVHAGLNPVQWFMLAIGLAVLVWTLRLVRRTAAPATMPSTRHVVLRDTNESRAFHAAFVVGALVITSVFAFTGWFTPLERIVLTGVSGALLLAAIVRALPWRRALPIAPSFGALLLLQEPADIMPRTELIMGGSIWRGAYDQIIGTEHGEDLCGAPTVTHTEAKRKTGAQRFSLGVRRHLTNGTRLTVEGNMLTGRDVVQSMGTGPVERPPRPVNMRALGADVTLEGRNALFSAGVMNGTMSRKGIETGGTAFVSTARLGAHRGFFLEGHYGDPRYFTTTGDFRYLGFGYTFGERGPRLLIAGGDGTVMGVHVPILQRFDIDLSLREPSMRGVGTREQVWTIGVRHRWPVQ